jgi:hypothetical protein
MGVYQRGKKVSAIAVLFSFLTSGQVNARWVLAAMFLREIVNRTNRGDPYDSFQSSISIRHQDFKNPDPTLHLHG